MKIKLNNNSIEWTKKQLEEIIIFLEKYNLKIIDSNQLFYFQRAFIHPSYAYENKLNCNYQKLEFLGDALLEKEISFYLFNKESLDEGQMSLDRTKMVCHASLSKIARDLNFEKFILVGTSYNSKNISAKNYEDIFEAFCAAIFLTFGEKALVNFIDKTVIYYFENNMLEDNIDYKSRFQEAMQRFGKHNIKYISQEVKKDKKHVFFTRVMCDGIVYGEGTGSKKHDSENLAAKDALNKRAINES